MIRKWNTSQFEPLLGLWLESTTYAHPFIAPQYWQESLPIVRDTYLPAAETLVFEEEQRLQGFVSVIEARFVGALFVAPDAIRQGIARKPERHALTRDGESHAGRCMSEIGG